MKNRVLALGFGSSSGWLEQGGWGLSVWKAAFEAKENLTVWNTECFPSPKSSQDKHLTKEIPEISISYRPIHLGGGGSSGGGRGVESFLWPALYPNCSLSNDSFT